MNPLRACLLMAAVLLAGCSNSAESTKSGYDLYVYHDKLTGCQYVSAGKSITPRMGADGKQICKEPQP